MQAATDIPICEQAAPACIRSSDSLGAPKQQQQKEIWATKINRECQPANPAAENGREEQREQAQAFSNG